MLACDMNSANSVEFNLRNKKTMKRLTCRKCEGHGLQSILKGHAASCLYNDCQCDTCKSVMNMRANALIRRFRHRQPGQQSAVLRTIKSKNGNMRLRIVPKSMENASKGTTVTYADGCARPIVSYQSQPATVYSPFDSTSPNSLSPSGSVSPTPSFVSLMPSPPPLESVDCLQYMLTNLMTQMLAAGQYPMDTKEDLIVTPIHPLVHSLLLYNQLQNLCTAA